MQYKTPGVYVEEISKFPPSIAEVATAIPVFIGYTQIAKVGVEDFHAEAIIRPHRITSVLEYERFFGTAGNKTGLQITITETTDAAGAVQTREANARNTVPLVNNMYYAIQAFYANGGGPCYIVSLGPMTGTLDGSAPFITGLNEAGKEDEITLNVFPESLSLSDADYAGLMTASLDQCARLQDRFTVMDLRDPVDPDTILDAASTFRDLSLPLANLKYGACYTPSVETIFDYINTDEATVTILRGQNGAAPAADGTTLADYNPDGGSIGDGTQYSLMKGALRDLPVTLPPSSLVVGQYAKTDETRGVWKAPANVALASVSKLTLKIGNDQQDDLNVHTTGKSINAIRAFAGKGILIWGARTLDGNSNEWRYVSVRRFFNMVEESTKKATEAFVFEPNDANTWNKVRAMIENFLILQWRAGALQGATPEQAFYVRVGLGQTMTALDILEGRMNVEIGMAVVRPAEFIILKFSHKLPEA